jgi:hypothetical protein
MVVDCVLGSVQLIRIALLKLIASQRTHEMVDCHSLFV